MTRCDGFSLRIGELASAISGQLCNDVDCVVSGVTIDSRVAAEGQVFFAIKGAHYDGHDFVGEAVARGVAAVVAEKRLDLPSGVALICVRDTIAALGDLAAWWRRSFSIPCVGITGSNGKTTTRAMAAAILGQRYSVLSTEGNFNNLIGLPLTLLRLNGMHELAVVEMGMNAKGEIARLTEISQPSVGLITNVTAAHLERLGTIEEVAHAKIELFERMSEQSIFIINNEDEWIRKLIKPFKQKCITFGMRNDSDVRFGNMKSLGLDSVDLTFYMLGEKISVRLKFPGVHNVMNALAATAVAVAFGIDGTDVATGLESVEPLAMRMERLQLANGVRLINDCYNANPMSMREAFRTVSGFKRAGRFIAVLGDMCELGEDSERLHFEVGRDAAAFGVQQLMVVGNFAGSIAEGAVKSGLSTRDVTVFSDIDQLCETLLGRLRKGDVVLVKASRAMRMERVVDYLRHTIGV